MALEIRVFTTETHLIVNRQLQSGMSISSESAVRLAPQAKRRVFGASCAAHVLHDGYTDTIYILLPLWQAEFGLTYAATGAMRALYTGVMALFQVPASTLSSRISGRILLAAGTAVAALGYCIAGASFGLTLLVLGLVLSGIGSSTQHPIASDLVAEAYAGPSSQAAIGTYNFAGDIGKALLPALTAMALTMMNWHMTAFMLGAAGLATAIAVFLFLPAEAGQHRLTNENSTSGNGANGDRRTGTVWQTQGFASLLSIGVADSATRMGFLTFLPFVLAAKGAAVSQTGLALALIFAGGALGKLGCGFLGSRLGVSNTIMITKLLTALGIVAVTVLPLAPAFVILPVLGLMLNGTSSVLYGSVPDYATPELRPRAFGVFYTGVIGSGAIAPILYGLFSDLAGLTLMMGIVAATALVTLPLSLQLRKTE